MAPSRYYSNTAVKTTLSSSVGTSDSQIQLASYTGMPTNYPFTLILEKDTANEEIVTVTSKVGSIYNITRAGTGGDGTTARAHTAGVPVEHGVSARDFADSRAHEDATTSVHGIANTANLVTLSGAQTLSDKTLTTPIIASFASATHNHTNAAGGGTLTSAAVSDFTEAAQDAAASMITGGTHSGIAVTYNDAGNTLSLNVNDPVISIDGDIAGSATMTNLGNVTINTGITAGVIVNADISGSAAIAPSKIAGTAITAADTGTVTSAMIANDSIVNADINSSAQIAYGKLNLTNSIVNADISASAAIALSKLATDPLARANHTGTQTASTISDFDTQVRTSRLDQMAAPTASVSVNSQKITNLAAPTASADAANKSYVDTQISNLIDGAPGTLDTLNEIAAAINDTANFADTVVLKSGSTMTGALNMGTNKITSLGTPTTSTDAATKGYVDGAVIAPSNLTGVITSVGNLTSTGAQTGTGSTFVMQDSPTLTTPNIGVATATSINGTSIPSSKTLVATDSTQYVVPSQTGNSGKYLTTDGTTSSWGTVDALPSQTSNSGKYLTTNGTTASWATVDALPSQTGNGGKYLTTDGTTATWATVTTDPTQDIFMMMGA